MGHVRRSRSPRCACCRTTWRASTRSSWAAGPATCRPGWRGAGRGRWGSTTAAEQLETAARLQAEHGISFPLILGNAERVPLPDASFDFAISEYGAVLWADPAAWVPEAARLLRPGGRLHVLTNHILSMVATAEDAGEDDPLEERFARSYFRPTRVDWPDGTSVEFHPTHGEWIRLFRDAGFEILELLEPQAPEGADDHLRLGAGGVGPALAHRGDLEGPQARLSRAVRRWLAWELPVGCDSDCPAYPFATRPRSAVRASVRDTMATSPVASSAPPIA